MSAASRLRDPPRTVTHVHHTPSPSFYLSFPFEVVAMPILCTIIIITNLFIINFLNVIVLSTMQNSNKLLSEPVFLLLANVSASNIAISIFVKLMSVILCG